MTSKHSLSLVFEKDARGGIIHIIFGAVHHSASIRLDRLSDPPGSYVSTRIAYAKQGESVRQKSQNKAECPYFW